MINRDYLPYQSAREYQDRGMAKWMGFFISEHASALSKEGDTVDFIDESDEEEKIMLLSQVFLGRQRILLYTNKEKSPYVGTIYDLSQDKFYFKSRDEIYSFTFDQVLKLTLAEEAE